MWRRGPGEVRRLGICGDFAGGRRGSCGNGGDQSADGVGIGEGAIGELNLKFGIEANEELDALEAAQSQVFFEVSFGAFAAKRFFSRSTLELIQEL